MESSVKFVNIVDTATGRPKTVDIVDDSGNLKYEFLIHLFEAGVLIPDKYSAAAFYSIVKGYRALKFKCDEFCFKAKALPDRVVTKQEFTEMSGSDNTHPDVSEMSGDEALAWLDELIESFERH